MDLSLFWIFLSFVFCVTLTVTQMGKKSLVIVVILVWWYFWLALSEFSLTGLFPPSDYAKLLYLVFFFFLTSFAVLFNSKKIYRYFSIDAETFLKKEVLNKESLFFKFQIFLLFPLFVFFCIRGLYLLLYVYEINFYRSEVYGLNTGSSALFFNSHVISSIYELLAGPLLLLGLFLGFSFYIYLKRSRVLAISYILIVMDSVMSAGRFGYHYILYSLILIVLYQMFIKKKVLSWKSLLLGAFVFLSIFLLSVSVSIKRNKSTSPISGFMERFVIDYHTNSFTIFSQELDNPESGIHKYTYGRSTFSGLEKYAAVILRSFNYKVNSQSDVIGGELMVNRVVGWNQKWEGKYYNAFGSMFYSMYRDGGVLFVILYGILFGCCLSYFSNGLVSKNPFHLSILNALSFIGIYGIFQPVTTGPILPSIFLIILFYKLNLQKISNFIRNTVFNV